MKKTQLRARLFCALCALSLSAATANAQLLFKISSDSLAKPSYVVGTLHTVSSTFAPQITGINEAINHTEQVFGEMDIKETRSAATTARIKEASMLPDGKTIKDVLTAEQLTKVNKLLRETMGTDFNNPKMLEQMGRLCPAALSNSIVVVLYIMRHAGNYNPDALIDLYFQQVAEANHEPTGGLETVDEQIKMLYGQPLERQTQMLMCLTENSEAMSQSLEDAVEAYMRQDLEGVGKLLEDQYGNGCDFTAEERDALIGNRNRDWAGKMTDIMAKNATLFVVGAGHLTGESNLLDLLRQKGYTVEAVTK